LAVLKIKWWRLALGILLLGILGCMAVAVLWVFVISLGKADPKISTAVIGGMFTVFAGLTAVIITQRSTKKREIEEAHREKKVEIYKEFLEKIERMLQSNNPRRKVEPISEEEIMTYLSRFKTSILLWGSPQVLKAYYDFERISGIGEDIFRAVDNLYRAIREDIGLSNKGLSPLHLVKMYLSDPESLDEAIKSYKRED
jgi:hypothetical protein